MQKLLEYLISVSLLALAYPLGLIVRNSTKDELKQGRIYFKLLIYATLIIGSLAALFGIDWLMFTAFFIALFTLSSLN